MKRAPIALDGMGGDAAPGIVVEGAALALKRNPQLRFQLYGRAPLIEPMLQKHADLAKACSLHHTEAIVEPDLKPSVALRQRRDSSMHAVINAVRSGEAAAAVSAGNTGALMALAVVRLRTLPGIDRPAIASCMPTKNRPCVMLDLGANAECSAENLYQFAIMGEVYARAVLGVDKPSVGVLNVGTEEMKGDSVVRDAAALIRDCDLNIRYAGFVEGSDVGEGKVDVVVTDGFTGNVALKMAEGTASLFADSLRRSLSGSWRGRLGYLLAKPALLRFRDRFDPRLYNGAMFLGVNGVVVKSHGGTDAVGFAAAINAAVTLIEQGTNRRIISELDRATREEALVPSLAVG